MNLFKTLDLRGLTFTSGFDLTAKELKRIKIDGILEIIMDQKKNFADAFKKWAKSNGHKFSNVDDGNRMVRVFIKKGKKKVK